MQFVAVTRCRIISLMFSLIHTFFGNVLECTSNRSYAHIYAVYSIYKERKKTDRRTKVALLKNWTEWDGKHLNKMCEWVSVSAIECTNGFFSFTYLSSYMWTKKTRKSFCSFYNHTVRSNVFVYGSMWAFVSSSSTHMQHAFSPVVSDAYKNISANRFLFALFTISFLSLFFAFSRVRRN